MAGAGPRPRSVRGQARGPRSPRSPVPGLPDVRALRRAPAHRRGGRLPHPAGPALRPLAHRPLHPRRAVRRPARRLRPHPGRGDLRVGHGDRADRAARPAPPARGGPARQLDRRRPRGAHPRPADRRGDGRSRAAAHRPGVPPSRSPRSRPRHPGVDRRHRWRTGRHGGSQPRRAPVRGAENGPRGRGARGRLGPGVRGRRDGVGGRRPGRRAGPPGLRSLPGHPHLVLRPRAAQPVLLGRREVLPQRDPRGRAPLGVPPRHRLPARRGRHRPGGLPGGVHQLLRHRGARRADGLRRLGVLDRHGAGLAAGLLPGEGAVRSSPGSISSRRRWTSSRPCCSTERGLSPRSPAPHQGAAAATRAPDGGTP